MLKKTMAALSILLSFGTNASFVGDEISITGIPGVGNVNAIIQQNEIEFTAPSYTSIQFFCGQSLEAGFACGFSSALDAPSLFLNITEMLDGDLRVDFSLAGDYEAFTISISGFSSGGGGFHGVNILHDGSYLLPAIEPNSGEILFPNLTWMQNTGTAPLDNDLTLTFTYDSIAFSLPTNTYNNGFSLVIPTSPVPIPATAWLFSSALAGLLALRKSRQEVSQLKR